jgi:ABC-type sugar transport system permease subunit
MRGRKFFLANKAYAYILPTMAVMLFIFLNPIIRMFIFSLEEWRYLRPQGFNNFKNYIDLLSSKHFYTSFSNNITIIAGVVPVVSLIALAFAQAIFLKIKGYKVYGFLFFIPVFMPDIVVAQVLTTVLNKAGPLNEFLISIGLGSLVQDWLGSSGFSLFSIIISLIWKNIGFALILFLARLTTIDPAIYESAEIDGASAINKYIFITLPMLASTISIYVILQIIGIMSFLFSYIHVMTAGGPGYSSTVLEYFIYVNIFKLQEIGKGSAAGVILIIFTMIIIYTWLFLSRKNEKKNRREMARAEK